MKIITSTHGLARVTTVLPALLITVWAWAQETLTIGSARYTNRTELPTKALNKYSLSQQIYTQAELGDVPFNVTAIGFNNSVDNIVTRAMDIYMVKTDKTGPTDAYDWIPVSAADLVFSGEVSFTAKGWNTIELTTPYHYTGTTNVAIFVNDKTGTTVSEDYPVCYVDRLTSPYRSIWNYSDEASFDPTTMSLVRPKSYCSNSRNQLRIITDSPTKPTSLAVTRTAYTATATWQGEADSWNLEYKLYDGTTWQAVNGLTTATYTMEGLDPETRYIFRVQAVVGGKPSVWATSSSFYTTASIAKPTNAICTAFSATSATLSWTENGTATQWQICLDGDTDNLIETGNVPYTFTGLTPGEKHTAKVRSVTDNDFSGWSTEITVESTDKTVIGSGTVFEGEGIPIHHGTKCAITEEIYTSTELGGEPKIIKSIGFYLPYAYSGAATTRNVDIYMVSTTRTYFTALGWLPVTAGDLVFSGEVDFLPAGWINIPLSQPFEYDGVNNIAIIVDDNTGNLNSLYFSVYNSTSNVTLHRAEDTNRDPASINYNGTLYNYKNLICLSMEDPVCRRPTGLETTLIGPDQAVLDWTEMGDATQWQLCVNGNEDNLIDVNEKPFTLTGLTTETAYTVKVRAVKGDVQGNWSTILNFTTLESNPVPFNVAASAKHTSATISWTGFSDSYNLQYKAADASDWQPVITVSEATATITGLTTATDYLCRVRGIVEEATSEWSEVTEFTTPAATTKLFTTAGNWNVDANWTPSGVPEATDNVVIMAPVTIPDGVVATANSITIEGDDYGGGGAMTRGSGGITRAPVASTASITIADGGQLRHGTDNLLVTVEKNVSGYGNNTTGGYQMLGLPLNEPCWPASITGMTTGNYDLYEFSLADAQEWRNYKAESFILYPNNESGYLYANSKDLTLAFTGRTDANNGDGYYSIVYVDDSTPVMPFTNGWRVFSNNSLCNAYVEFGTFDDDDNFVASDANFYKVNAAGGGFDLYKDYAVIAPGEAIFMEVSRSGRLHCSYDPIYRHEPTPEAGVCLLPTLPLHGKTTHQDGNQLYLKGDANGDGVVNVADIVCAVAYRNGTTLPGFNLAAADIDGDGEIGDGDIESIKEIIMNPNE